MEADFVKRRELETRLIPRLGELTADGKMEKEKKKIRAEMLCILRDYIDNRFPALIVADCVSGVDVEPCLNYIDSYLDILRRQELQPLTGDFIKWVVSKSILSAISPQVSDRAATALKKFMTKVVKENLQEAHREPFFVTLVLQLHGIVTGTAETISLLPEDTTAVYIKARIIGITGPAGTRRIVATGCLLNLLLVDNCMPSTMIPYHHTILWNATLRIFPTASLSVQTCCVRLWSSLLERDFASWMVCRLAMDKILQVENFLMTEFRFPKPLQDYVNAQAKFLEVLSKMLPQFDTNCLAGIDLESVIVWGTAALKFWIESEPARVRVEGLASSVCEVLCSIQAASHHPELLPELRELVQKLVTVLLARFEDPDILARLRPFMAFLVTIEEASESKEPWLKLMFDQQMAKLPGQRKRLASLKLARILLAALFHSGPSEATRNLLQGLVPNESDMLKTAEEGILANNSQVLLALLRLVSDLTDAELIQPATAVAFFSLPFLSGRHDDQLATGSKRHGSSIPLLSKLARSAIRWTDGVPKARIDCFTPLVKVKGFTEWRLSILMAAFKDEQAAVRKTARHFLPELLKSVDYHSLNRVVTCAFQEARGSEELDDAMLSAAVAICANAVKTTGGPCLLCEGEPGAFVDPHISRQQVDAAAYLENSLASGKAGIGCATLLATTAFHLKGGVSLHLAEKSLVLLHPGADDDPSFDAVREKYIVSFKEMVACHGDQLEETIRRVMDKSNFTTPTGNVDDFFVKFISVCAKQRSGSTLSYWAFKEYFSLILETSTGTDVSLGKAFRILVKDIAAAEGVYPTCIFARNVRAVSNLLCNYFLSYGKASDGTDELDQEIENTLELTRKLFYFDDVNQMLYIAGEYLIPMLNVQPEAERELARLISDQVYAVMTDFKKKDRDDFIPITLARYVASLPLGQMPNVAEMRRICGTSMSDMSSFRRADCNVQLLQAINYNDTAVFKALFYLNSLKLQPNATNSDILMEVMTRECGYVCQFMGFRLAMTLDDHYEIHPQVMKSFTIIIGLLDEQFIDKEANRVMAVLRAATTKGDKAVSLWVQFMRRLSAQVLGQLLPRILLDIQPLLKFESSWELFAVIFDEQATHDVDRESFELTAAVLNGTEEGMARMQPYIRNKVTRGEKMINIGIRLLNDECETVGSVVLEKLYANLDIALDEEIISKLVPVLLQTLRRCNDKNTRLLVVKCLGRIGAVDPGRLSISSVEDPQTSSRDIVFVDHKDFMPHLIERSWQAYARETDSVLSEKIAYCIQELLRRALADPDEDEIMEKLTAACRREIEPLMHTQLISFTEPSVTADSPIVDHVPSFEVWLQQCFVMGAISVKHESLKVVFRALIWMGETRDTLFTRYILSQLIVRLIIEDDDILEKYQQEMETVLRRVLEGGPEWTQLAAHIVFSIMDTLEQFAMHRKARGQLSVRLDTELKITEKLLNGIVSAKTTDGELLIVASAEKCNCFFRALKWCEQYGIKEGGAFDRNAYFHLEKIYMRLQNVDGVVGAYECLSRSVPPSAAERILALEANGDYHEAMALYSLDKENEPQMVNCLLRLNQPQLALSTATASFERYLGEESVCDILRANQIEAASHLRDWHQVEKLVEDRDPLTLASRAPWGSACAAILCAVKNEQIDVMNSRLNMARETLIGQLTAMTIEHSDTYTQAYNYITQLQILDEIASAASVNIGNGVRRKHGLAIATTRWRARSDRAIQCAASLEPVLRVRRELLRMFPEDGSTEHISQLLVQSCRLARQAGHLQIAWTFLVEAQSLNVNHKEVGMEQARFEFQKGDQQQAISLLSKLLNGKFAEMTGMFDKFVAFVEKAPNGSDKILKKSREDRASFAEVQLLRAEYMMKAGAVAAGDLYKIYMALKSLDVPSEDLFYRIALFCDGMYMLDNKEPLFNLATTILKVYGSALRNGRNHLFHAMPRMLTLWLDVTQKKTEKIAELSRTKAVEMPNRDEKIEKEKQDIEKMNSEMHHQFRNLDHYYFYTAFPQLISRIVHPSEEVFLKLKIILADLIFKFPHQCLWLSIGVYRSSPWMKTLRQKRCANVYQVAKNKDKRIESLIDQYDYVSALMIQLAERSHDLSPAIYKNLDELFPALYDFFKHGKLNQSILMGAKERKLYGTKTVTPAVMVPLTEMMDHALPQAVEQKQQLESFSQIMIDSHSPIEQAMGAMPEVLIHSIDKHFMVLKSMQKPKRLSLRGADGRRFQIMCKPGDELRKDARFMDVNRMMNSLMRQNPEARRRHLHVKTFTVLPLQAAGGILEWVSNLSPYRHVLQPLINIAAPRVVPDAEWFQNWDKSSSVDEKLAKMRGFFYEHYPLVMAEWFRQQFPDPSTWHSARSNFAKSAAVMSMIGFVLGLGDRHGENILLDLKDGCVVHVDYNLIFNKGELLPVKEVVPFRLTRNMVHGLGPTGVEGAFRKSCEATMKVMRESRETLLTVIQTFVHDPLLEWQDSSRAQQHRRHEKPGQPQSVTPAADAVALIGKRLEGHIVSPDVYREKYNCPPMSLEGQVNKLIEIASDEKQLASMYIGWAPFL